MTPRQTIQLVSKTQRTIPSGFLQGRESPILPNTPDLSFTTYRKRSAFCLEAQLCLRKPKEAPGPPGPFSKPGKFARGPKLRTGKSGQSEENPHPPSLLDHVSSDLFVLFWGGGEGVVIVSLCRLQKAKLFPY